MTIETPKNLIPAEVDLVGMDGNAGVLIGAVARGLRHAGNTQDVINGFRVEAMSGDYNHVLQTCMAYSEGTFDE